MVANRSALVASAFQSHGDVFRRLAGQARAKLKAVAGCEQTNFAGYAPVLDAICEFALSAESLNPQAKIANLKSASQIELINDITMSILEREQAKLQSQFKEQHSDTTRDTLDKLYKVEEQLQHVAFHLFGGTRPPYPELSNELYSTYQEMVESFAPQHPFLSANRVASNPVFGAYTVAWALRKSTEADVVRKSVLSNPNQMSGILFELYDEQLKSETNGKMPLADVGILYQALNSQIVPGQRVQLEVFDQPNGSEVPDIEISFEILERVDPHTGEATMGQTWGPYVSTPDTLLELHSPFSNVYVNAPITVQLGDGITQQIGAPSQFSVDAILVLAKQVLIQAGGADGTTELQTVALFAEEAECSGVQTVTVREGMALSVSWQGAKAHPWTSFVVNVPAAANEDVEFMRRRLRKFLTAFRSHSKGALVRLAAKIDHSRMTKDSRGVALLKKLTRDKILIHFDAGKFYQLDQDVMGKMLGVGYHDLAQSRFTPESDSYLMDVLGGIKD